MMERLGKQASILSTFYTIKKILRRNHLKEINPFEVRVKSRYLSNAVVFTSCCN